MENKHLSIVGYGNNRAENDYYPTPKETTEALLLRETFEGSIWECASGEGWMSKVIEEWGYNVYSSDIRIDDNVYGDKGIDFLKANKFVDNIITNPPYKYAKDFLEHSLRCSRKKVALLLKLVFLESASRYPIFMLNNLEHIFVFSRRQKIYRLGEVGKNSGLIAYAWFVWNKDYYGKPMVDWINEK